VDAIVEQIEKNVEQSAYLVQLIERSKLLELVAEAPLNIVCFRYCGATDAENKEILMRLQESGLAVPSGTMIDGRFAIRVANSNHRTLKEDFDLLVRAVEDLGREIVDAP
jgi:glutamate/tyrosine decarboxylase-like PLP-dependent enzyme